MTDELIVRARQSCCRLCLAPDSECVPIFNTAAADKEPLSTKIQACVNIKVNETDRLSSRICHACISYLNSWQSFKNRCVAAQNKQQHWLEMAKTNIRRELDSLRVGGQSKTTTTTASCNSPPKLSTQSLLKSQKIPPQQRPMPAPFVIKEEPKDASKTQSIIPVQKNINEGEICIKPDTDHLNLLADSAIEDANENDLSLGQQDRSGNEEGPQILTSLGLTHINTVNPFTFLSTELGNETLSDANKTAESVDNSTSISEATQSTDPKPLPACRVCNLVFSTRANARRHERNIHCKNLFGNENELPKTTTPSATATKRTSNSAPIAPEMLGIYEYDKPEKYRHMLTDTKILFLRKNDEFLKQYQNLTCKCCQRIYPTYKQFMAHLRKKYPTLPKLTCFKCLKQFQSKSMFVSHLKKKICINLYTLYLSDESISKVESYFQLTDKMGTKELLTNKVYECKLCNKTFRLKLEFRSHVYEAHGDHQRKDIPLGACGFCGIEAEDPLVRRRHYNNMECIVVLICGTCDEKFENHQQFIEHVYKVHLPPTSGNPGDEDLKAIHLATPLSGDSHSEASPENSPNINNLNIPQNCKICGLRYNSYYNVIRHMESKHPDQLPKTYSCEKCDAGFPRQSSLREHMFEVHGTTLSRSKRENITCQMCPEVFEIREKWVSHQTDTHSRYACCFCNYEEKNLEEFKSHLEIHPRSSRVSVGSSSMDYVTKDLQQILNGGRDADDEMEEDCDADDQQPAKKIKLDGKVKKRSCKICGSEFNTNLGLTNHMRAHATQQSFKKSNSDGKKSAPNKTIKKPTPGFVAKRENAIFRRVRCRMCQKRFSTKKSYRKHMMVDHQVKNVNFIRCSVCKSEFTHERGLKVHMFKVHGTSLKDQALEIQYECSFCATVYRNKDQLNAHLNSVHGSDENSKSTDVANETSSTVCWFQCRYCPAHFNSNKKLAIHVNSHDEFDSNDYSCKDCGNVYSGRKSLWVHRYKKHPLISDPSECVFCNKVFFDKNMLVLHLKTHSEAGAGDEVDKIQALLEEKKKEQADAVNGEEKSTSTNKRSETATTAASKKQITCSVCSKPFSDQDLFDKHMKIHEMELYTDNPLASMFDTEPEDPNKFYMGRMGENGEFGCDICPKTFPILTALKVHRNWHFRSDGKQLMADPNSVWRGVSRKKRRSSYGPPQNCPYCSSTFISKNNLRRHIAELHKRESGSVEKCFEIVIEKPLECRKCEKTFQTNAEWVEHKIGDIKTSSSESTFEWGCEICGKIVSRKERLIQHMSVHLRGDDPNKTNEIEAESNSRDSGTSYRSGDKEDNRSSVETNSEEMANEFENGHVVGQEDATDDEDMDFGDESEHEIVSFDQEDSIIEEVQENEEKETTIPSYSCDLCQVYFDTSKQLRRHVTSHFLNGPGSVTITDISKERRNSQPHSISSCTDDEKSSVVEI